MDLLRIADALVEDLAALRFGPPVAHVYDPLVYARAPYDIYQRRYGGPPKEVLFVGMNPGPWGMAQTGVPFGDVTLVRDWLGIDVPVGRPRREHPKRPVLGFACCRREVSGSRLWGWARATFVTPERFFERFFVANYCPLVFFDREGRNLTPDHLRARDREALAVACDRALARTVRRLRPRLVVGIGRFAEGCARRALEGQGVRVGGVPHPSPASPAANRGWEALLRDALARLDIRF